MAVDLRSLQLHAGRSSAPTVPRAPGTWPLPLYLCNSALCWLSAWLRVEVQQGFCLSQKMQLKLMKMFILKYYFDTFAQHINLFSRWHFVKLKKMYNV